MDNNSLQVNIPLYLHPQFESMARRINHEDLTGKGLHVGTPHITVRYGINTTDVDLIQKTLKNLFPFYIRFGKVITFPPSSHSEGTSVLVVAIDSPQIKAVNQTVDEKLPTIPANLSYIPHMTLAYVKTEQVNKYLDMDLLAGQEFITNQLTLVLKDNSEVSIPM